MKAPVSAFPSEPSLFPPASALRVMHRIPIDPGAPTGRRLFDLPLSFVTANPPASGWTSLLVLFSNAAADASLTLTANRGFVCSTCEFEWVTSGRNQTRVQSRPMILNQHSILFAANANAFLIKM